MITTGWLGFGGVIFVVSHFIYSTIGKGSFFSFDQIITFHQKKSTTQFFTVFFSFW